MRLGYKSLVVLIILSTMAGCSSYVIGNRKLSDVSQLSTLKKGNSTKSDVYELLGQPSDVRWYSTESPVYPTEKALWRYCKIAGKTEAVPLPWIAMMTSTNSYTGVAAFVYFDDRGKFDHYEFESNSGSMHSFQHAFCVSRALDSANSLPWTDMLKTEMERAGKPFNPSDVEKTADLPAFQRPLDAVELWKALSKKESPKT